MGSVPDIVRTGREAQCGVNAAVVACGMKIFSVADVIGLVWKNGFGSTISQSTFYWKLLITCREIKVIPLYTCISLSLYAISFQLQLCNAHIKIVLWNDNCCYGISYCLCSVLVEVIVIVQA